MNSDYARVEHALRYLDENARRQPTLAEVARSVHLSPFHFHRLFRRWAGVTPKQFLQAVTVARGKALLDTGAGVLGAALGAGLSGPGRLHDHFVVVEGVSPGEWKARGAGLVIRYGVHPSPFGPVLAAATERGLCALRFAADEDAAAELAELAAEWPNARLVADPGATREPALQAFGGADRRRVALRVRGTPFQLQVWRALLAVPEGATLSYGALARRIGRPGAARAVAGAVAANPVGYLIPCHRVIRTLGVLGGYRWGVDRKRALLAWEAARPAAQG